MRISNIFNPIVFVFLLIILTGNVSLLHAQVKWADDTSGYLTIHNETDQDLIFFAGRINNNSLLGGVRKFSSRKIDFFEKITEKNGAFLLHAVLESDYSKKGTDINREEIVFTDIVVFDIYDLKMNNITVSQITMGNGEVLFSNSTGMAIQIRNGSPNGIVITTLAPFERNKKVYMEFDFYGYVLYPVFYFSTNSTNSGIEIKIDQTGARRAMPVIQGKGNAPVIVFNSPAEINDQFIRLLNQF